MTAASIPDKDSPAWEAWAETYPLHRAVVGERPGKSTMELRTQMCLEWISSARTRPTQLRLAAEHWGVSERAYERVHAEAIRRLKAQFTVDRPEFLSEKLAQLEQLIQAGLDSGQLSAAAGAMGMLLRATGTAEPQQNKHL